MGENIRFKPFHSISVRYHLYYRDLNLSISNTKLDEYSYLLMIFGDY